MFKEKKNKYSIDQTYKHIPAFKSNYVKTNWKIKLIHDKGLDSFKLKSLRDGLNYLIFNLM